MDYTILMDELETSCHIQNLHVSSTVSHLGVELYEQVLTSFVPRSGRSLAKERMFPNGIH